MLHGWKWTAPLVSFPILHWIRRNRSPSSITKSYLWKSPRGNNTVLPWSVKAAMICARHTSPLRLVFLIVVSLTFVTVMGEVLGGGWWREYPRSRAGTRAVTLVGAFKRSGVQ